MYVIFPADEVVYLSYGRVIYVPVNPNPEICPIRTNSLPLDSAQTDPNISLKRKSASCKDSIPGTSRSQFDLVLDRPSSSKADVSAEPVTNKSRKKLPKLNFKLLSRSSSSSKSEPLYSARVRKSIGTIETTATVTPPSEAFRKFCVIGSNGEEKNSCEHVSNSDSKRSSKRSSSSSKTSKQVSVVQEDKDSKRSSKQSSTSSKSGKQEKKSPLPPSPSRTKVQTPNVDARKEPVRKTSVPLLTANQEVFYPLATSREKNLEEPVLDKPSKVRSSPFRLSFRRSKTPEVPPVRPERKKEKKPAKSKPEAKRKLSFSDFVTTSRDRVELRVEVPPLASETSRREKSPVLNFFRKTPSPRNLGCDRTPNINRDSARLNSHLVHKSEIEDHPRPSSSTGHKHAASAGASKEKGTVSRQRRERV